MRSYSGHCKYFDGFDCNCWGGYGFVAAQINCCRWTVAHWSCLSIARIARAGSLDIGQCCSCFGMEQLLMN